MNEKILNTLMHLFAIIAPAQGNESDRRRVVEAFLRPQLNQYNDLLVQRELSHDLKAYLDDPYRDGRVPASFVTLLQP